MDNRRGRPVTLENIPNRTRHSRERRADGLEKVVPIFGDTKVVPPFSPFGEMQPRTQSEVQPCRRQYPGGQFTGVMPAVLKHGHAQHPHTLPVAPVRVTGQYFKAPATNQPKGLYLVTFSVFVVTTYLAIQILIDQAEVFLPFIFALLCVIILDPLKKFIVRVFHKLTVSMLQQLHLKVFLAEKTHTVGDEDRGETANVAGQVYDSLPDDSTTDGSSTPKNRTTEVPVPFVQKTVLTLSIVLTLVLTGRGVSLAARVFLHAGEDISMNIEHYRKGTQRLKDWIQMLIREMQMESLDWGPILDDILSYLESIGSILTANFVSKMAQLSVTIIFLIYMLWSPINVESSPVAKEVVRTTGTYITVKSIISAISGVLVFITLSATDLDLPGAFGLLAFIANFLPGIGSGVATIAPCLLAIIDIRKQPYQVLAAFILQCVVHIIIDFFIEPVFFGMSSEIHTVMVILGIYIFGKVWGVPGMFVSVPLLAIVRLLLKSVKMATRTEDLDTFVFLDSVLAGRWLGAQQEDDVELEGREPSEDCFPLRRGELQSPHNENPSKEERDFCVSTWEAMIGQVHKYYNRYRLAADSGLLLTMTIGLCVLA